MRLFGCASARSVFGAYAGVSRPVDIRRTRLRETLRRAARFILHNLWLKGSISMPVIVSLTAFPLFISLLLLFVKPQKAIARIVRSSAVIIIALSVTAAVQNFNTIFTADLSGYGWIHYGVPVIELLMAGYMIYCGIRHKSFLVSVFALAQIGLVLWFELKGGHDLAVTQSLYLDKLSLLMILIVGIVGSMICIYAIEYMKDYHRLHPEIQDRRNVFFAALFLFMSAMFALVICNDMRLMLFCWEITSLCSFWLIGYTRTKEATGNSLHALTINVFGGLLFTAGIVLLGTQYRVVDFNSLLLLTPDATTVMLAVFLMAAAGLTKSAQMPFSKWLLGAMAAPTPTSAMLHSSTMVKAGVYLIIRLAPMLGRNAPGVTIALVGGITFFAAALMAVAQSDAKKILAYSTISNLGLIVACAAINTAESLWAAIMLIVFHAIAKSLLFLSVGSTEHQLGSRDVEDMDGLYKISTTLTMLLIIGIAGMFVAPFGMLISKWAAMKAFVDSGNLVIILLVAFGSTITLFFWTKWMGKLIANTNRTAPTSYIMRADEKISMFPMAAMVIIVCILHPVISDVFVIPYIDSNLHISFVSPINAFDTTIIIFMMLLLFMLPLILIPLYKNYRVKPTSVYLSGENTGDNESFYGSMGEVRQLELRNWYMKGMLGGAKISGIGQAVCAAVLVVGFCIMIGGKFI